MILIDTNVLIYAHDLDAGLKHERARAIVRDLWETRLGVISTQVLQEFYVVATRKFEPPMLRSEARELIAAYASWPVVRVDVELILDATALEEREQLSFWDALIVEAARRAGATRLVTEDLQAGRRIAGIMIENPFAAADLRPA